MENVSLSPRKTPRVALIREELAALTGDYRIAVVLNQMLYWTQRVKDFDLLLEEERSIQPHCNVQPRHGWIYKTANELNEETMLNVDRTTMRRYLSLLVEQGWLDERINPHNRWDKTTQYRVNLRKLQKDLLEIGWVFSGFEGQDSLSREPFAALRKDFAPSNEPMDIPHQEIQENTNVQNTHSREDFTSSKGQNHIAFEKDQENSMMQNAPPRVQNALSNGDNPPSNVKKSPFIYLTENTHKTTNKDHTQRAREVSQKSPIDPVERMEGVCESFDKSVLEKGPQPQSPYPPQSSRQQSNASAPEAMVQLWKKHVCQEVLEPNKKRSHLLEAALQMHFQKDLKRWEAFCAHIKNVPFLMGGGPNGWHISLDWLLREGNLLKVREHNYDPPEMREQKQTQTQTQTPSQSHLVTSDHELQVRAVLQTIKDPTWEKWCSELAKGVRLNEFTLLYKPLSLSDLKDIANARFLECEEGRLVWVGSTDQRTLNRIDDLRLDISWVFAKEFPHARTFRTRLMSPYPPSIAEGESYA